MTKKYFTALVNYNNWTDAMIMEWLNQIGEEQWTRTISSSFSGVRETAVHMVSAKKIWIDFWNKETDPVYLSKTFQGTREDLIKVWERSSVDLQMVIENYPEEEYMDPITFIYPNGKQGQMIFWETFLHFINHATYHRGQLVTLLRQTGFTNFSNTDLATYFINTGI